MANENERFFITCHYEFCKERPQFLCDCKSGGILLCQKHLTEHRTADNANIHNPESLYNDPNAATKDLLIQLLDNKILHFCEMKKNQLEKSKAALSEIIKDQNIYVQECDEKILKLLQTKEKICSTRKISKIYQSRIEKFLSASPDSSFNDIQKWYDAEFSNNAAESSHSRNQFSIIIKKGKEELASQTYQNIFDIEKFVTPQLLNLLYCKILISDIPKFKDVKFLENSYYNRDLISSKYEMSSFLKEFLTDEAKEILFYILNLSKSHKSVATAASNSITILNWSGFSFLDLDLRGINIPFADLSNVSLINIDFEGSDLQWVDFSRTSCYWANFKNCALDNAKFSLRAKLIRDFIYRSRDCATSLQFSPDEKNLCYIGQRLRPTICGLDEERYTTLPHGNVYTVCFAPNGEYIAYGVLIKLYMYGKFQLKRLNFR
ncbi:unnamed protein product [Blepharisma stoltei]|uniref:Pentapeptide repeat-containing protein n=1 Tax=Blepharisma stoltei TaxID=1481888 RepID=A0AAU9KJH0_9CILI|nr:unnamed protein product [Blepharisma stoltei]